MEQSEIESVLKDFDELTMALSDEQVGKEIQKQKKKYMMPTNTDLQGFGTIKEIVSCFKCNRVPFVYQRKICKNCGRILCTDCSEDLLKNKLRCPSAECLETNKQPMEVLETLNSIFPCSFKTKLLSERHSCKFKESSDKESVEPQDVKDLNLEQLQDHFENDKDCELRRTCTACDQLFSTYQLFKQHLKFDCETPLIHCQTCDEQLTRHPCHEKKRDELRKLVSKVIPENLKKQIDDLREQVSKLYVQFKEYDSYKKRMGEYEDYVVQQEAIKKVKNEKIVQIQGLADYFRQQMYDQYDE